MVKTVAEIQLKCCIINGILRLTYERHCRLDSRQRRFHQSPLQPSLHPLKCVSSHWRHSWLVQFSVIKKNTWWDVMINESMGLIFLKNTTKIEKCSIVAGSNLCEIDPITSVDCPASWIHATAEVPQIKWTISPGQGPCSIEGSSKVTFQTVAQ